MKATPAAALALTLFGCASLGQLLEEQRWPDACEKAWGNEADETKVARAMAQKAQADYRLHVFEPSELEQILPYVPAQLRSGAVVLVESQLRVRQLPSCSLSASPELGSKAGVWHHRACCDTGQWLTLDGREDEWKRIEKAERDARIAKEKRRERYSGKLGGLRLLWDTVGGAGIGMGRDLLWLSTLSTIDLDVSDVRGAELSPGGWVRAVRKNVELAMRSHPVPDGKASAEDADLAKRKAASAIVLGQLVRGGTGCEVEARGECSSYSLLEAEGPLTSASLTATFGVCEPDATSSCFVRAQAPLTLPNAGTTSARVNGVFTSPLALEQLLH